MGGIYAIYGICGI